MNLNKIGIASYLIKYDRLIQQYKDKLKVNHIIIKPFSEETKRFNQLYYLCNRGYVEAKVECCEFSKHAYIAKYNFLNPNWDYDNYHSCFKTKSAAKRVINTFLKTHNKYQYITSISVNKCEPRYCFIPVGTFTNIHKNTYIYFLKINLDTDECSEYLYDYLVKDIVSGEASLYTEPQINAINKRLNS